MVDWRVVIVEDDETVARIHCRYVAGHPGFSVAAVARSGAQARQLVENLRPSLVLLDLGLPGVDGISLLRELRRCGDPVEVIVITAHASPKVVRTAVQLGVVDYLVKPFWSARLAEALEAFTTRMGALAGGPLTQAAVDQVRRGCADEVRSPTSLIKSQRLQEVQSALAAGRESLSADQVARSTGMSRVTARRYLEHLVSLGQCTVDLLVDGPGRPRKAYRAWLSSPIRDASSATATRHLAG